MRIAIVDDIAEERKLLLKRLVAQLDIHKVQADILEYDCGESFLAAADGLKFDVVFLDIYMSGVNGIETAKKLRERDRECLLIFTTTSIDHALEGFHVRAIQYLVKPYTSRDIAELTNEILARIPKPDKYIDVKVHGSDIRLHFKDIVYAEHFSHMIHIHTTAGKDLATRQSFGNFTAYFKDEPRFFICSRGVIINMEHARDFDGKSVVTDAGDLVSVIRELVKTARQTFMEFLLRS
mgnify:FL=1